MICLYVRKLRKFFEYVWKYAESNWKGDIKKCKIDVVGYSMGVPMSRKAILGGKCVDDPSIDLGPPLTNKVNTYIGISGTNNGSYLCTGLGYSDVFAKIATAYVPGCNLVTGFHPDSAFIKDINLIKPAGNGSVKHGYEGQHRFSLMSFEHDDIVGYSTVGGMGFGKCDIIQDNEKDFTDHESLPNKRAKFIARMLAHSAVVQGICKRMLPKNVTKPRNDISTLPDHLKSLPLSETLGYPYYTDIKEVIDVLDKQFPLVENNAPAALNKNGLGDICVSLKYCRITKALTVIIVEAKTLKKMDVRGFDNHYVKLHLYEDKMALSERNTSTKRHTLNPHYLESFEFEIAPAKMDKVHLILSVWNNGSRDKIVGDVVLASEKIKIDSVPVAGQEQWSEMMRTGRTVPVHCYSLVGRK
ncbi:lipase (class 2) domain-containing protein [Ditylenchus destructor]|nr:lipase (class 2) domain-containing protein [Ditylenchus destructor]